MTHNLRKCMPLIQAFCSLKSRKDKQKLLRAFELCILKAAQEMSVNTLKGNVMLTPHQKKVLRKYKKVLQTLSSQSLPRPRKKKVVLQKGTGLFTILLPIIASAIAGAVSK